MRTRISILMTAGVINFGASFSDAYAGENASDAPQTLGRASGKKPCSPLPISVLMTSGITIQIDYLQLQTCISGGQTFSSRVDTRITEETAVDAKVIHFNFIDFTIDYKVDETVVESYETLEKLWSQLLGLPLVVAPGAAPPLRQPCQTFQTCMADCAFRISEANRGVDRATHFSDKPALTDNEIKQIKTSSNNLRNNVGKA